MRIIICCLHDQREEQYSNIADKNDCFLNIFSSLCNYVIIIQHREYLTLTGDCVW